MVVCYLIDAIGNFMEHINVYAELSEVVLAIFTIALVCVTWKLVIATQQLAKDANESSARQVSVQAWAELSRRWNSTEMISARVNLAVQVGVNQSTSLVNRKTHKVEPHKPSSLGEYPEPILNFFEDLAMVRKRKLIDEELAANSFGYYARRWWLILFSYVKDVQSSDAGGKTIWREYEKYASELETNYTVKTNKDDLDNFRFSESQLNHDER